ncbi:hypothetical protein A2U01_0088946, partial [Trifolium medium]|nr:hypothetical protein [Trifolium medium]
MLCNRSSWWTWRVRVLEDKLLKESEGRGAEDVVTEEERAVDRSGVYAGLS